MLIVLQKSMREPPMAGLMTDGQVLSLWRVPHKMDSNLLHWEQDHCATEPEFQLRTSLRGVSHALFSILKFLSRTLSLSSHVFLNHHLYADDTQRFFSFHPRTL